MERIETFPLTKAVLLILSGCFSFGNYVVLYVLIILLHAVSLHYILLMPQYLSGTRPCKFRIVSLSLIILVSSPFNLYFIYCA